jgi:hypothetical protein
VTDAGPHYLPQGFNTTCRARGSGGGQQCLPARARGPVSHRARGRTGGRSCAVRRDAGRRRSAQSAPRCAASVFRSPRGAADLPIGLGMTEWRGGVRGEALVPVAGVGVFDPVRARPSSKPIRRSVRSHAAQWLHGNRRATAERGGPRGRNRRRADSTARPTPSSQLEILRPQSRQFACRPGGNVVHLAMP